MAYSASNPSDMRRNAEQSARDAANDLAGKASEYAEKAGKQIDSALQSAESTARQVAESGREATQQVGVVAGNFKTAVNKSVKDQPLTTLAVAAAVGFVVGALWKS